MRVLVLAVALFFLLPMKWSFCSPNDISVHFKEFVVRDGRWGAKFSLENNTRDHVVTHIDYRGEYKKDGKKKTFTRKREGKLKLNKPLLLGKSFTLTVLLSAPATSHIENITLAVTDYRYRNKAQKSTSPGDHLGKQLAATVQDYLGSQYVWGGTSPAGFDCSGLVHMSARNMALPSPAPAQNRPKVEYLLPKNMFAPEIWYFSAENLQVRWIM